ncbi:guanine nucleotide-binding protein subunit alpha [Mortierella sp. AM989]|nr:guanine nucleotide-binding protein subunit alpha [Mortierella sp. AM989]
MKVIHGRGFTERERMAYKEVIFRNTLGSMRAILEAMDDLELPLSYDTNRDYANTIMNMLSQGVHEQLPQGVVIAIQKLWLDPNVHQAYQSNLQYQFTESAIYFIESVERIAMSTYIPSDQDILRSRISTFGISESSFMIDNINFKMYDTGPERKKWIHCFDNVDAVLFVVAISEYDIPDRLEEEMRLFDYFCNSMWLVKTTFILFLNKMDRFKEKLLVTPLRNRFPEYDGDNDDKQASLYIANRFIGMNKSDKKQIYVHFTCAIDSNRIKFVMAAVSDFISQSNLKDCSSL